MKVSKVATTTVVLVEAEEKLLEQILWEWMCSVEDTKQETYKFAEKLYKEL